MKSTYFLRQVLLLFFVLFFSETFSQVKKNVTIPPKPSNQLSKSALDKAIYRDVQKILDQKSVLDQVIADDLIVQGGACAGLDCINGENLSFITFKAKENNTRLHFDDTSVSAGFPANDWQLTANESASGGLNKFSIEDITGAKVPFTIEAGAKTNALYVSSAGRIGMGTNNPSLDLHIENSNTPSVRLAQNSSGGFTSQTWDMGGNEANFFIRDVTGGSRLPFRIQPGAPTSSIYIQSDGRIKIVNAIIPNSDIRLKKNFEKIDNATGIIQQLNPLKYDFKYDELKEMGLPKTRQFGLIAQELELVVPELVSQFDKEKDKETYKGINYTGLIPILIKGMQEQQTEIERLKAKLADYEALNSRLVRLEAMLTNEEKDKKADKKEDK